MWYATTQHKIRTHNNKTVRCIKKTNAVWTRAQLLLLLLSQCCNCYTYTSKQRQTITKQQPRTANEKEEEEEKEHQQKKTTLAVYIAALWFYVSIWIRIKVYRMQLARYWLQFYLLSWAHCVRSSFSSLRSSIMHIYLEAMNAFTTHILISSRELVNWWK